MNGLASINVELTSRCCKSCWCCGRRKIEQSNPAIANDWGDMPFELAGKIATQLPEGIVVQLHNNGEPLMYPHFKDAVKLFKKQITSIDTNGKLLCHKANEIIDNLDTLAISVIQDDTETEEQYDTIKRFLHIKGKYKPLVVLRLNGNVDRARYEEFGCLIATRILHSPMGSFDYTKQVTIPEIGICQDFLHRMAIDRFGKVSICVRFDPDRLGVIGDANTQPLEEIWNSDLRRQWQELHKQGRRDEIPLCAKCHFWGLPTGR